MTTDRKRENRTTQPDETRATKDRQPPTQDANDPGNRRPQQGGRSETDKLAEKVAIAATHFANAVEDDTHKAHGAGIAPGISFLTAHAQITLWALLDSIGEWLVEQGLTPNDV